MDDRNLLARALAAMDEWQIAQTLRDEIRRALRQPAAAVAVPRGSFMTREAAAEFMRKRLKREPTEAQIEACIDAYSALFGDLAPVEAMTADAERLDWLETMTVNVRKPLLYGSKDVFWSSPANNDPSEPAGPSDIRARIDAARTSAGGTGEAK